MLNKLAEAESLATKALSVASAVEPFNSNLALGLVVPIPTLSDIVNPPENETLLSVLLKVTIVAPALELLCLFN